MSGLPDDNQGWTRLRVILSKLGMRQRRPVFGDASLIERDVVSTQVVPDSQLSLTFETHVEPVAEPAIVPQVQRQQVPQSGWPYSLMIDWWTIGLWMSIMLLVVLRFYRIDSIQSELYGDIEIVQSYVRNVIDGRWPWYFNLSSGPLYHYLIAPVLMWLGTGYDQIKVASILVSLLILGMTYMVARRLGGRELAMITLMVAGTGSWFLLFSRLGNSQIFVPLVTVGSLLGMLYYLQTNRVGWLIMSAVVASMGLYSYPQSFIVAPVMWLTLFALWWTGVAKRRNDLILYAVVFAVCALPFVWMYIDNPALAAGSYVTEKIEDVDNIPGRLFEVIWRGALAYFTLGDIVFRNNPTGVPHIDVVSSVFFVVGLVIWVRNPQLRPWAPLLLVPLVLLHVPSLLVLRYPDQVPSASRSIGAAPYVYLFIAYGLYETYLLVAKWRRIIAGVVLAVILTVSLQQNIERYFVRYVAGLPYGDVAIGREIVRFAEMLSPNTLVYVVGCCWRDGTPEPFFSQIQMKEPERLNRFDPAETLTCTALESIPRPAVLIWSIDNPLPNEQVEACANEFRPVLHTNRDGVPLFFSSALIGYDKPTLQIFRQDEADSQTGGDQTTTVTEEVPVVNEPVLDPIGDVVTINGITTEVLVSAIDTGSIGDMFDGNYESLIRGDNQNPMVVTLTMPEPIAVSQLVLELAGMRNFRVDLEVTTPDDQVVLTNQYSESESDPTVTFDLPASTQATSVKVTITELDVPSDVKVYVHIRELQLIN